MSLTHSPSIITDGLVLNLDTANIRSYPKSGATWNDLSGAGRNATLTNAPLFVGENNGILRFNGKGQYATCAHPTGSSFGITYEIFLKLNEIEDSTILGFNNSTYFSGLSITAGTFIGYLSGSNYKYFYNTTPQIEVWYHIAMYVGSADAKDIKGYVNGVLDSTTTLHTGVGYTPTTLAIATTNDLSTYRLGCDIAIIRCYNRELLASEVRRNFNAIRGRFGI
jgi:hypothetical protein